MKVFTAHTRPNAPPVLVREGFSWGAFVFGPFWMLGHRAWIPGVLLACGWIVAALLPGQAVRRLAMFGLAWVAGLFGQEWRRWSLERRGYVMPHVVAAPHVDFALSRLLDRRPDLIEDAVR